MNFSAKNVRNRLFFICDCLNMKKAIMPVQNAKAKILKNGFLHFKPKLQKRVDLFLASAKWKPISRPCLSGCCGERIDGEKNLILEEG